MILAESGWFSASEVEVNKMWLGLYKNIKDYETPAKRQGHKSKTEFSFEAMAETLGNIIENKFDKPKVLKLPELKKIELPQLKKI
jgi:hypothetical protein